MPSICLQYGLGVALGGFARPPTPISAFYFLLSAFARMWFWVVCSSSSFKVRGSAFVVRCCASGRNLKHRKAACRPSAVSLVDITRPGGGWGRPREPESYLRRVSGETPMSLPGCHNRFGLCNWASSAPPVVRQTCRPERRIEGALFGKPGNMGAAGRRSGIGPGAVPCGSHKCLISKHLRG
jgi:hypothetical protein